MTALILGLLVAAPACKAETTRELIRDRHFLRGFTVYDPASGKHVERGVLQWEECIGDPVWGLAQWHSLHSIEGVEGERLETGGVRFSNETKSITVGKPGTDSGDVAFGIDADLEYPDGPRRHGQDWPHLLASQRFKPTPTIAEMTELRFHVEGLLKRSKRYEMEGYSPNVHAAQFVTTVTVQNLNRESAGYGDFLWLNIPQYDDRRPVTARFVAPDQAQKKLIFTVPGEALSGQSAHDGEWVVFDADILPFVNEALDEAWQRDFLPDSRDLNDYHLGGISTGWEVPGTLSVEMQIRNLSLRVSTE